MTEKLKANYIDHICIAVNDVKKAEKDYVDAFGWEVAYRYVDEPEKIRVTLYGVPEKGLCSSAIMWITAKSLWKCSRKIRSS